MNLLEKLDALMDEQQLNRSKLSQISGVPYTTIDGLYKKGFENTKLSTIRKLASALGVTLDYLVGNEPETKKAPGLSPEAQKFAKQYDGLDAHGKKVVASLLADEVERMTVGAEPVKPKTKIIPLLGTSAAAGVGEPDTGLDFTPYEVPADSKGEFAVRITGDSMEPHLHDGDIALCLKRNPQIGEIVVIMVNGSLLVKQYISDGYNIYLRSLNRKRKDCDYDIWHTSTDTVSCFGTVIMPKIPLVQQ